MNFKKHLYFGQTIEGYSIPVINEREARAGAGILFFFAMISFFNSFLLHDFRLTKIFVTYFMIDFFIRVVINPKFSPSLILGKFFVRFQKPEWVGVPQKRYAWSLGLILSIVMFILIVVLELMTPLKLFICIVCLSLLFFETAFGICLGCKIFWLLKKDTQHCAGDACSIENHKQKIHLFEILIIVLTISSVLFFTSSVYEESVKPEAMKCSSGKCATGKCGSDMMK